MNDIVELYKQAVFVLPLKARLLSCTDEQLIECYSGNEEKVNAFLKAMYYLIETDVDFLYMTDVIHKRILEVVNHNRYTYKDYSDMNNYVIRNLNAIKATSKKDRKERATNYCIDQCKKRGIENFDYITLLRSITYDASVIIKFANNDYNIEDKQLFLSSVSYFLEEMPIVFSELDAIDGVRKVCDEYIKECKFLDFTSKNNARLIKKLLLCVDSE